MGLAGESYEREEAKKGKAEARLKVLLYYIEGFGEKGGLEKGGGEEGEGAADGEESQQLAAEARKDNEGKTICRDNDIPPIIHICQLVRYIVIIQQCCCYSARNSTSKNPNNIKRISRRYT